MNRTTFPLLGSLLLLGACMDRELPTALSPEGAAFDQVPGGPVVNSLADPGDGTCDVDDVGDGCTLREAIAFANPGGTITFAAALSGQTITLTSGELTIAKSLTITGPGAGSLSVSGNNASRVFLINTGTTATLSGLTITGGSARFGGGIYNPGGTLTLTNSTVSGNSVELYGGGILNFGTLTLTNSTVSGNRAEFGGGIWNDGTLALTHSTVSGNSATRNGGGIWNSLWGPATLRNTIVANSPSGGNCAGTITDGGYNLDSGMTCGFTATGSLSSADPKLDPELKNNGGPTETHALLAGSPAIDAGTCTDHEGNTVATDQRGVARPQPSGGACDIGAFELEMTPAQRLESLIALSANTLGVSTGTQQKLLEARTHLNQGQILPACNKLKEYIADVQNQRGKQISTRDADLLIAKAQEIRSALGC